MRAAATVLLSSLLGAASVLATSLPSAPFDISSLAARQAPPPPPPGCRNNQSRLCWDGTNNIDTDYYAAGPRTGRIVDVSFRIQNVTLAPDGRSRTYLTVNGQMPGPTIVANWGDTIRVTVKNELQHNGTSIHWHGVRMLRNFLNDGVNGVGECALAPNDTKVYTFIAEQYGTTWYHSHFSAQYGDGVWGPIVINGPATAEYDIDLGPITLSENFWPLTAFQSAWVAERSGPPAPQNFLVNGVNVNPTNLTQGTRHKITFTPGKKHRLRFINTSVDQFFRVSLDGHSMQVIQSDFVPIVPYNTTSVGIAIGQRYDVIINADQTAGTYWLRTWAICGGNANNGNGTANAYVRYSTATDVLPTTTPQTVSTAGCVDETTIVPRVPITVDSSAFPTNNTIMGVSAPSLTNVLGSNVFRWSIAGGLPMKVQLGNPSVLVLKNGQTMAADMNSVFIDGANTTAYWVIQNLAPIPHPIHLHLHDFNVVARGSGTYNSSTAVHTWVNPPRRDVAMLPPNGYLMIAFKADNPGLGIMHCHIAWHVSEGLSLQLVERQAEMLSGTTLSAAWNTTCSRWNTWEASAANVYAPLSDSGLRRRAEIDAF